MNQTIKAETTAIPTIAAAAIPAIVPTLIPEESSPLAAAEAVLEALVVTRVTVERGAVLATGVVLLVPVLAAAGGVVGTVDTEVGVETVDPDADPVRDGLAAAEVVVRLADAEVVVVKTRGGPDGGVIPEPLVEVLAACEAVVVVEPPRPS